MSRLASYKGLGAPQLLVENLSTASTALTLTDDQQGRLLVWNGQASAARIGLPAPETGMVYTILFAADGVSTATKVTSTQGDSDIYVNNDTTGQGVALASTLEGGSAVQLVAISDFRWFARRWGGSTLAWTSTST